MTMRLSLRQSLEKDWVGKKHYNIKFIYLLYIIGLVFTRRMVKAHQVLESNVPILEGLLALNREDKEPYTAEYFKHQISLQEEHYRTKVV